VLGLINLATYCGDHKPLSVIGMFYVLPECRGQSIGLELFKRVMDDSEEEKFLFGGSSL